MADRENTPRKRAAFPEVLEEAGDLCEVGVVEDEGPGHDPLAERI